MEITQMQTLQIDDVTLFFEFGIPAVPEECKSDRTSFYMEQRVATYDRNTNKVINFWGTIEITVGPKCSNIADIVEEMIKFERIDVIYKSLA